MAAKKIKKENTDCAVKTKKAFQAGLSIGRNMKKSTSKTKK